jgi:hypothetical protein
MNQCLTGCVDDPCFARLTKAVSRRADLRRDSIDHGRGDDGWVRSFNKVTSDYGDAADTDDLVIRLVLRELRF